MGLIVCPECKNEVSQYAEGCPNCGFPIKNFMEENKLVDIEKILLCPKCGHHYGGFQNNKDDIYIKCKYCNSIVVQTDVTWEEFYKNHGYENEIEFTNKYGNNQFSEEAYQHRLATIKQENEKRNQNKQVSASPSTPQVTCPYCNSTNTKKLTTAKRAGSILGLGILSKKIGKQWHCNNCNSDF